MTKTDELLREKIRKILTIDRGVVYGDFPGLIADLELLFNQEVEKWIAERMQTDNTYADGYVDGYFDSGKTPPPPITLDEADKLVQQTDYIIEATHQDINPINLGDAAAFFIEGYEYCRSRMTCSEKPNNSQKTEGGER